MENMPKKITEIKCNGVVRFEAKTRYIVYTLIDGDKKEYFIPVNLPRNTRPEKSLDIIDDSSDFVNGFKVVQTANKEYAYIREEDNTLLPYRYDIAADFNEYGYAMVGKDARVSWIDRNFRYLDDDKEMFLDEEENNYNFNGFLCVSDFSKGDHPLSKTYDFKYNNEVKYFDISGKIKEFHKFDGENIRKGESKKKFSYYSTEFNENGYATANEENLVLLSSGYYLTAKDLIRTSMDHIFLKTINNKIEKQEQAYTKFLRDIEQNTINIADNLSKYNNLIAEYGIGKIELRKEELISRYGKDVYERALTDSSFACLIVNQEIPDKIVDLKLLQSSLSKRGIPSYIDTEENIFYYNANKHVKRITY